jgi:fructokinase
MSCAEPAEPHCSQGTTGKLKGMMTVKILSVGEVLWDVIGEAEYLGGAPLNFAVASQRLGNSVALMTAVGADERGNRAFQTMDELGLTAEFVQRVTGRPTGTAMVSTDRDGNTVFAIERPAAFDCVAVDAVLLSRLAHIAPDWLYFGTLAPANLQVEAALLCIKENLPRTRCFYDVNLRTGHWNLALVEKLSVAADVLKLNHHEAELLFKQTQGKNGYSLEGFCRQWKSAYGISTICVTLGSHGCAIFAGDTLRFFDGFSIEVVDTVGAGDAFAAAFLHGLNAEWPLEKNATFANALGALVASRPGATPDWTLEECHDLIQSRSSARETFHPAEPQ